MSLEGAKNSLSFIKNISMYKQSIQKLDGPWQRTCIVLVTIWFCLLVDVVVKRLIASATCN